MVTYVWRTTTFAFIIVGKFTNNMDHREDQRKLEPQYAVAFGIA